MEDSGNNGKYNRWYLLINLSHSIPLNGDVLERFWIGKDVSYDYLKLFFFFLLQGICWVCDDHEEFGHRF